MIGELDAEGPRCAEESRGAEHVIDANHALSIQLVSEVQAEERHAPSVARGGVGRTCVEQDKPGLSEFRGIELVEVNKRLIATFATHGDVACR